MAKIKVFALGGLDERGKNLYVVEVNEQIFVFDAGIRLPEREILGIDIIIPDYSYLRENKKRIKGIFISKPSDDAFGVLPYMLKDFNKIKTEYKVPIFASKLTDFMIRQKLKNFRFINNNEIVIKTIEAREKILFDNVMIETFKTTTSIPGSLGFVLTVTNPSNSHLQERIIYTGDYIFDGANRNDFTTDIQHLASVCKRDILLLISEASCASRKNFTAPHHKIQKIIEPILKEAPGRVIIACYDQDLYRVNEILNAIQETDSKRKIAVYGPTLNEILLKVNDLNAFNINKSQIINLAETIKKDTVIIVTGSGERLFIRMNKIAVGNDDFLKLEANDTVILATPPIPGNELAHAALLDDLARTDVKVISISEKQACSLNASYEDIKLMVNIIQPKYFLPVKGLYKDFVKAQAAAIDAGVLHNNALIHDNGEVITFENGKLIDNFVKSTFNRNSRAGDRNYGPTKSAENLIKTGDVYVDGIGVGDIGAIVINERKQLQRDGVLITGVTVNRKTKEIISLIDAQMRGVVYLTNNEEMLKNLQKIIINVLEKWKVSSNINITDVKNKMIKDLQDYIKKETGKMPMILTVINEI